MVHEMLQVEHPDISLATVYRNLAKFKAEGKIMSVATVRGIARFDANTNPHVHFICTGCDAVLDLHQIEVPQSLSTSVEESSRCSVQGCQLSFTGLCGNCN
jgi:Fur family peroxide stress response transcriptional regulator